MKRERFLSIGKSRLFGTTELTNGAFRLYVLLLFKMDRTRSREPHSKSNEFLLKWREFDDLGISRGSFSRNIKELVKKEYISVSGARQKRLCKIIKW